MKLARNKLTALAVSALLVLACLAGLPAFGTAKGEASHTPVTEAQYGQTVSVSVDTAGVSGVTGAKVYYTTYGGSTAFRAVDMTADGSVYSATLPATLTVVPYIYYYIELTGAETTTVGSAAEPYKIAVSPEASYAAPAVSVTEAIAIQGNRADFIELKNTGDAPIQLSKLSLKMYEYVYQGESEALTFTKDDSNYKGEIFLAVNGADGKSKARITADSEVTIAPGETFVVFTGKTAVNTTEQGGLAATVAAFNYDYLRNQYTDTRVGDKGSLIGKLADIEDTRAFLAVSDPYSADSAVIPDPSGDYTETKFGTLWEVTYDGAAVTSVILGMNNDGSVNLTDKSTAKALSETAGFGSVQYSPYTVQVTQGGQTVTVQSRMTEAREAGITLGVERPLPSAALTADVVDLTSADEQKEVDLSDLFAFDNGMYYANEYDVTYRIKKDAGEYAAVDGSVTTLDGVGTYTVEVTFAPDGASPYAAEYAFQALADTNAPAISDVTVSDDDAFGADFTVSATVTDDALAEESPVTLYYKTAENAAYKAVAMTAGSNDVYTAAVESVKAPYLYWYIEAKDMLDNTSTHGSAAEPNEATFAASSAQQTNPLLITEANVIKSRRADFVEMVNNSNKPIALSKVTLQRFDTVVKSGSFQDNIVNGEPNMQSGLATSTATEESGTRTPITADNEVYVQPGETFVVFVGEMNSGGGSNLAKAPYNIEYIKDFYGEFSGFNAGQLTANVNAFVCAEPIDPSPSFTAGSYGTAWRVVYDGEVSSTVILGMDNDGNLAADDASTGTVEATVGSVQYSYYTVDITLGGQTVTVQSRISDNRQAPISFNETVEGQVPAEGYVFRPEATLTESAVTVNLAAAPFDLSEYITVKANGYEAGEYTIAAFEDDAPIPDMTAYTPAGAGSKTIKFTVSSTADPADFAEYSVTLALTVIDAPAITVTAPDTAELLYGQKDSIDVSTFYTVDAGGFAGQYDVAVTSSLPLVDGKIMTAGTYTITVTVSPKTAGAFETQTEMFTVTVTARTVPTIAADSTATRPIAGDTFDLSTLFTVDKKDFADAAVAYTAERDGAPVTVTGSTIAAEAGTYTVKAVVTDADSAFAPIEKEVTLTLSLLPPSVAGDDTTLQLKDITQADVSGLFEISANSYAGRYTVTYSATRGGEAVTLTDGKYLPLVRGTYEVTATVTSTDDAFETVTHTITVTLAKAVPSVTSENGSVTVDKGASVDVSGLFVVSGNEYGSGEYTISYTVTRDGAAVAVNGATFVADAAGTYTVTITVTSADGSFEAVTATAEMAVTLTEEKGCGCGSAAVSAGAGLTGLALLAAAGALFVRRGRKDRKPRPAK